MNVPEWFWEGRRKHHLQSSSGFLQAKPRIQQWSGFVAGCLYPWLQPYRLIMCKCDQTFIFSSYHFKSWLMRGDTWKARQGLRFFEQRAFHSNAHAGCGRALTHRSPLIQKRQQKVFLETAERKLRYKENYEWDDESLHCPHSHFILENYELDKLI